MSETNNDSQGKQPRELSVAIVCLIIFILGILVVPAFNGFRSRAFVRSVFLLGLPWLLLTLLLAILGLRRIIRDRRGPGLKVLATAIISLSAVLVVCWFHFWSTEPFRPAYEMICGTNISGLAKAIGIYANDANDRLPEADKWCDLLVGHDLTTPKQFICNGSDAVLGESSYAFNKNLAGRKLSEIPGDVVLLFETSPGWNVVGGPEILTTENHKDGCNVAFVDTHVEFVQKEDLSNLKWEVEIGERGPNESGG